MRAKIKGFFKNRTPWQAMSVRLKDAVSVVIMVILYNACFIIPHANLKYINIYKITWIFVGGVFIFIPLYAILRLTFRTLKSEFLFFITSTALWALYPILFHLVFHGFDSDLTYKIGGNAIYLDGNLTIYGYFYDLQNPLFFLALYASIIFGLHMYKKLKTKNKG